jgi:hypothetical protein
MNSVCRVGLQQGNGNSWQKQTCEKRPCVIVHELCHLKEHNHSKRYYALFDIAMPDWRERHAPECIRVCVDNELRIGSGWRRPA